MSSKPANPFALKAIFGGTFDPPHKGHLLPLCEILDALKIDLCELIPCHIPVHKQASSAAHHRLAMTKLLAQYDPRLRVNSIEIASDQPSYSANTVAKLKANSEHQALCFVMGLDSFLSLTSWFSPESILRHCHIIVMMRGETFQASTENQSFAEQRQQEANKVIQFFQAQLDTAHTVAIDTVAIDTVALDTLAIDKEKLPLSNKDLLALLPQQVHLLSKITQTAQNADINGILRASKHGELVFVLNEQQDISSTAIRQAIKRGLATKQWLTPEIADYIQAKQLYTK